MKLKPKKMEEGRKRRMKKRERLKEATSLWEESAESA